MAGGKPDGGRVVEKRIARSGLTEHSAPVPLKDSSRTEIVAVPNYIRHTDGTYDLSVKLVRYEKQRGSRRETDSITLDQEPVGNLVEALQEFAAIADVGIGSVLVFPLAPEGGVTRADATKLAELLPTYLARTDVVERLSEALSDEVLSNMGSLLKIADLRRGIGELERLLADGETDEKKYQAWCLGHGCGVRYQLLASSESS